MQASIELQPLVNMEALLYERVEADEGYEAEMSSDLPPLDWVREMVETLMMLVESGDQEAAYECTEHAWDRDEMVDFVKTAPGTHPTWNAFQTWALSVLDSIEE